MTTRRQTGHARPVRKTERPDAIGWGKPKAKGSASSPDLSVNRMDMGIHHLKEPPLRSCQGREVKDEF